MSPVVSIGDPRVQPFAYITDGTKLYEVQSYRTVPRRFKLPERRVVMIDVARDEERELSEQDVLGQFRLVRPAPRVAPVTPAELIAARRIRLRA